MKAFIKDTGKLVDVEPRKNNKNFFIWSENEFVDIDIDVLIFPKFDIGDSVYWYDGFRYKILDMIYDVSNDKIYYRVKMDINSTIKILDETSLRKEPLKINDSKKDDITLEIKLPEYSIRDNAEDTFTSQFIRGRIKTACKDWVAKNPIQKTRPMTDKERIEWAMNNNEHLTFFFDNRSKHSYTKELSINEILSIKYYYKSKNDKDKKYYMEKDLL
jgi:hypothetical protein